MKRLIVLLVAPLSACVVVPYDQQPVVYSSSPAYVYSQPVAPGYVVPAPVYGPPVYVGPPVHFNFGFNYRSGGGYHHGYRGHGYGRGGWRR